MNCLTMSGELGYSGPNNICYGTGGERIRGLRMGADDYICKPFQIGELLARVETVLRRTQLMAERLEIDDVAIDPKSRTVTKAGEQVELTVKDLICCMSL